MKSIPILVAITLVACGDNESVTTLSILGAPEFLAYRNGDGEWVQPPAFTKGYVHTYVLEPAAETEIVLVCRREDGNVVTQELLVTREELASTLSATVNGWPDPPCGSSLPNPVRVQVAGLMNESGFVVVDGTEVSGSGLWPYSVDTFSGVKDVIGVGNRGRVVIRHDEPALAGTSMVDLDLATNGSDLIAANMGVVGIDGSDVVSASTQLLTKNGTVIDSFTQLPKFVVIPAAQLVPDDFQALTVVAEVAAQQATRTAWVNVTDHMPASIVLLPRIGHVTYDADGVGAAWEALPEYTSLYAGYSDATHTQIVTATKPWLDAHSPTQIRLDVDIPGFQSEWNVEPATSTHYFNVDVRTADLYLSTSISDSAHVNALERLRNNVRQQALLRNLEDR